MKWGYSGFTKSETRGMLKDIKGEEIVKSHECKDYICPVCGLEISERVYIWQGMCDSCMNREAKEKR